MEAFGPSEENNFTFNKSGESGDDCSTGVNTEIGQFKAEEEDLKKCNFMVSDLEDDQADLVNGDAADQTTDGEEVVKKPKKKKYASNNYHIICCYISRFLLKKSGKKWFCHMYSKCLFLDHLV